MMRIFILFLLFLPFLLSAQPAKVVSVIPVKFNSKGMHAPVPYSQQIMTRGYTRIPTLNVPYTFAGSNPRYQPTMVTKKSIARSLGYFAGRVGTLTPATKALLIAYGAYEANCLTQNFPSLCMDGAPDDLIPGTTCEVGTPMPDIGCTVSAPFGGNYKVDWAGYKTGGRSAAEALSNVKKAWSGSLPVCNGTGSTSKQVLTNPAPVGPYSGGHYVGSFSGKTTCTWQVLNTATQQMETKTSETTSSFTGISLVFQSSPYCPPEGVYADFLQLHLLTPTSGVCVKPFEPVVRPVPITPEWLEDQINNNPQPIVDADIGLDDFVDWETGLPRPDAFENPTLDPVSDAFADAAEAIANGTVQTTNPTAPHYVPPELMPNLLVQINNWHEGNTFVDVFNGKTVDPDSPPPEETTIDWNKFPGITKAQYEASNNAWGSAATKNAPNVDAELDKITQEQQKLKDYINEPLPAMPFEINLIDLLNLPTSNGCKGFTVPASINGQSKSITVDQHCPPYDAWGRPVVSWLLSIFTILVCFQIFRRTLEVTF